MLIGKIVEVRGIKILAKMDKKLHRILLKMERLFLLHKLIVMLKLG